MMSTNTNEKKKDREKIKKNDISFVVAAWTTVVIAVMILMSRKKCF